jgi:hypothetical protein
MRVFEIYGDNCKSDDNSKELSEVFPFSFYKALVKSKAN